MKRSIEVDMSPEAIDQRLRDVGQLCRLGLTIAKAKLLGSVEEVRARDAQAAARKAGAEPDAAQAAPGGATSGAEPGAPGQQRQP